MLVLDTDTDSNSTLENRLFWIFATWTPPAALANASTGAPILLIS
jgi:hypothetical protein